MDVVGKLTDIKPKIRKISGQITPQTQPPNLLEALIAVIGERKPSQEETHRTDEISVQFYTDPVMPQELTLDFNDRNLISQGAKGSGKIHRRLFERIRLASKLDINGTIESEESIELSEDSDQDFSPRKQMERTQQSKNEFLFKRKLMSHGIQINFAQPQESQHHTLRSPTERGSPMLGMQDSTIHSDRNEELKVEEETSNLDDDFGLKVEPFRSEKTLRVRVPEERGRCRSDNSERQQRKSCNALPCFENIVAPLRTRHEYSGLRRATSDPPMKFKKIKVGSDGERSESQESQEREFGQQRHQSNPAVFKTQENLKHFLNIELMPIEKNNDSEQEEEEEEKQIRRLPLELLDQDEKESVSSTQRQHLSEEPKSMARDELETSSRQGQEPPQNAKQLKLTRMETKMPKWSKRTKCLKKLYRMVESPLFNLFVFLAILANTIFMAMDRYPIPEDEIIVIERANLVFYFIFLLEMMLKLIAMGCVGYLSRAFNIFDGTIVILSTIELVVTFSLESDNYESGAFTVFRSFRLLRIFKIARSWTSFQELLTKIGQTLKDLWSFLILLMIVIYCFAMVGAELFAYGAYFNYETNLVAGQDQEGSLPAKVNFNGLANSIICIFVVLSGQDWQQILFDYYRNFGIVATVYFVLLIIIGNFVFLNLLLALLLRDFEDPTLFMKKIDSDAKTRKGRKAYLEKDTFMLHRARRSSLKGRWISFKKGIRNIFIRKKKRKVKASQTDPNHMMKLFQLENYNQPSRVKTISIQARRNSMYQSGSFGPKSNMSGVQSSLKKDDLSIKSNSPERNLLGDPNRANSKESSEAGPISSVGSDERDSVELQRQETILVRERAMEGKSLCIFRPTHRLRKCIHTFIEHKFFYYLVLILILISSILLALQDPLDDPFSQKAAILFFVDCGITAAFCLEATLKIISYGLVCNGKNSYLRNMWDIIDFIIVVFSVVSILIDSSQTKSFRAFRLLRVLRPLRFISKNEGLKLAVKALLMSIPDIFNVLIISLLFFLVFGIFSVNYFKGGFYYCEINGEESHYNPAFRYLQTKQDCLQVEGSVWKNRDSNFDNAFNAFLLLFQISTSQGWVEAMFWGVESRGIDQVPQLDHRPYWAFFFIFLYLVGGLFHVNLFVGVLIQKFEEMKEILGKNFLLTQAQREWIVVRLVSYKFKPKRRLQTYIKSKCRQRIFKCVEPQAFEWFIMICIILNTSLMAVTWYGEPPQLVDALQICNYIFAGIFTLEALLKIIALGRFYFKDSWNVFDFVIVVGTLLSILLSQTTSLDLGTQTTLVRTFRIGRIFRLIRKAKALRTIFQTFLITLPSMANVGGILLIVIYIYAILGVNLFASVKLQDNLDEHANFQNFGFAFMTLMRVSTGQAWNAIMHDTVRQKSADFQCEHNTSYLSIQANQGQPNGCGSQLGYVFFISFVVVITFIYLNLFIAIILQGFEDTAESANLKLNGDAYEQFRDKWSKYDKKGTGLIRIYDLEKFIRDLEPPLGLPKKLRTSDRIIKTLVGNLQIPSYEDFKYFGFHDVLQGIIRETLIRQKVKEALLARKEKKALFPEDEKASEYDHRVVEIELETAMKDITTDMNVWKESKIYQRMRKEQKKYIKQKQKLKVDRHDSRYIWALWIISRRLKARLVRRKFEQNVKKAITLKKTDTIFEKLE